MEALKISKGGNALKILSSSQGSGTKGRGVPQEALQCGSIDTDNEFFFKTPYDLEFSPLVRHQRGENPALLSDI